MLKPCKRIEIVIERSQQRTIARALDEIGVTGYTILFNAGGGGDRGRRRADDASGADENCVFIVSTDREDQVAAVVERVKPLLDLYGGICLVSNADWG